MGELVPVAWDAVVSICRDRSLSWPSADTSPANEEAQQFQEQTIVARQSSSVKHSVGKAEREATLR
jgi:hypothetical protein